MKALINACSYDFNSFLNNSYILFDSEIIETGNMKDFKGADEIIDCKGCMILPGLVNCHTHIYSEFSRGMNIPFNPKCFTDILTQLWWKLDSQLDSSSIYHSALAYGIECIKNGVTSIIDHHASGLFIKGSLEELKKSICDFLSLRGLFCFETSDRFNVDECINENITFSKNSSEKYAGLLGMHASMSLSDGSLRKISSVIEEKPIHIHLAESLDDVIDCMKKYGKSITERLDEYGLLTRGSILSHCVHISDREAQVIAERNCIAAINPTSNMNNAVGLADFEMLKKHGVHCIIGNDGLGANITRDFLNTLFLMKNRLGSPVKFQIDDLFQMIRNGYEYIGSVLNIKLGRIEKGFKADLISVPYLPPTPLTEDSIAGHIVYGLFDSFHPRDVWVDGKQLLKNGCHNFDENELYEEIRQASIDVWQRVKNIKGEF